jgi:hypothetical protein
MENFNDEIVRCEHTPDMFDMVIEKGEYQDKYNLTISIIIEEWYRTARMLENYDNEDLEFHKHCQIGSKTSFYCLISKLFGREYAKKIELYIVIAIGLDIKVWDFFESWEKFNETL